jgi:HK97 gp10 family phage protein
MSTFGIGIAGLNELQKKFANVSDRLDNHIISAVNNCVVAIQAEAKTEVKYKTGALQRSITHRKVNRKNGEAYVSAGNINVGYAPYVEFGTRFNINLPFLVNITPSEQSAFARKFKVANPKRFTHQPTRPFLFTSFDKQYGLLLKEISNFKL